MSEKKVELEKLIKKREAFKARLASAKKYIAEQKAKLSSLDESEKATLRLEIQSRLERIQESWFSFMEIQSSIEDVAEDFENQLEEREKTESAYYKLEAVLKQFIIENKSDTVILETQETESIKTGSQAIDARSEVRDTFQSLIHSNESIGQIQKFHYLRASLQGGAVQVIQSIEFSEANYQLAWELLCERYDNKALLIHTHVKALFDLPNITKESSKEIRELIDQLSKNLRSLEMLNLPTNEWDTLIIYMVVNKLDSTTSREWEETKKDPILTLYELKEFLKHKVDFLEKLELSSKDPVRPKDKQQNKTRAYNTVTNSVQCPLCKATHQLYNCQTFLEYPLAKKVEQIKRLRLCLNCFKPRHVQRDCTAGVCRKCGAKHNTLIHTEKTEVQQGKEETVQCKTSIMQASQVLLATACVQVVDKKGYAHVCRALLDCSAQSNFITLELSKRLQLPTSKVNISVTGINQATSMVTNRVQVTIQSIHTAFEAKIPCLVIENLSDNLPTYDVDYNTCNIPPHIRLADPAYHTSSTIDMIIGAELFWNLLCVGRHELGPNAPILQKTKLGWVVTGTSAVNAKGNRISCNFSREIDIHRQLEKFWTIEEPPSEGFLSAEERKCEEIFKTTTVRNEEGRFIVRIPLRDPPETLGESRSTAVQRLQSLERRFERNPSFKARYKDFMTQYINLGHITRVIEEASQGHTYYFPHHGVLNETSLTTKLRVVFDSSAPTSTGTSFNDIQYVGPTLQPELLSILLRFRQHTFVICADITKMYRQVLVHPEQRSLQRILWREDPSHDINVYELNTVTYGTASALYLAVKCIRQLGQECQQEFPQASTIILSDFYVDDMITGGEDEDELLKNVQEVALVLKSGGFELRKWSGNSVNLLEGLNTQTETEWFKIGGEVENTKTLGVYWDNSKDNLIFNIQLQKESRVTKRTILGQIAQIFDPLGLVIPVIMKAKVILKKVWTIKLTWDESLPLDLHHKWTKFREQLQLLNFLRIPRHVICSRAKSVELHGFADASEEAYGACICLRSTDLQGKITVNLLISKTRVAPMSNITIPRLELCAALVLTQLLKKVLTSLTLTFEKIYLWSDSTVALHWINTQPNELQTFVANRVSQIQRATNIENWHHITTEDNPADLLSRGVNAKELINNGMWWHGSNWLVRERDTWPRSLLEFTGYCKKKK